MGLFFGTDGLRGKLDSGLSPEIAFRCANALASVDKSKTQKIIIGTDTRKTCDLLMLMFASGAMCAGADVTIVNVCPTAGIGFLTKEKGFDFGVVISASHNPAEYNGIKIFNSQGVKPSEDFEREIEKRMLELNRVSFERIGRLKTDYSLLSDYENFLKNITKTELNKNKIIDFSGLRVVLDTANGSASNIAPKIFEELGASVFVLSNQPNGLNINQNCGSLYIQNLKQKVLETNADIGFAFDGDSDRVIAIDDKGNIIDGDQIIYIFANYYLKNNQLENKTVVGTVHTNGGIEKELNKIGISLIRTDVGDKFVGEALEKHNLLIGGEQSGHIFVKDKLQTGDGILNALMLCVILKIHQKPMSQIYKIKLFKQTNINIKVADKHKVLANINSDIDLIRKENANKARVLVRASGTEQVIRIMTESEDEKISKQIAEKIKNIIEKQDKGDCLCVE